MNHDRIAIPVRLPLRAPRRVQLQVEVLVDSCTCSVRYIPFAPRVHVAWVRGTGYDLRGLCRPGHSRFVSKPSSAPYDGVWDPRRATKFSVCILSRSPDAFYLPDLVCSSTPRTVCVLVEA